MIIKNVLFFVTDVLVDEMKATSEEVGDIDHVGAPDSTAVSADQQLVDQVHSEGYGVPHHV